MHENGSLLLFCWQYFKETFKPEKQIMLISIRNMWECMASVQYILEWHSQILVLCIYQAHSSSERRYRCRGLRWFPWNSTPVFCAMMRNKVSKYSPGLMATVLSVLCWLSWAHPLRGWWEGMALWRKRPGASIAAVIIWIQDCWVRSFGPLHGWEMTCLYLLGTLSVSTPQTLPQYKLSWPFDLLCTKSQVAFAQLHCLCDLLFLIHDAFKKHSRVGSVEVSTSIC